MDDGGRGSRSEEGHNGLVWCDGCGAYHTPQDPHHGEDRRDPARPPRGSLGRRRDDYSMRTTITRKVVVVTVVLANALFLAGEALLFGQPSCL